MTNDEIRNKSKIRNTSHRLVGYFDSPAALLFWQTARVLLPSAHEPSDAATNSAARESFPRLEGKRPPRSVHRIHASVPPGIAQFMDRHARFRHGSLARRFA